MNQGMTLQSAIVRQQTGTARAGSVATCRGQASELPNAKKTIGIKAVA